MISTKLVDEAKKLAISAHKGQTYGPDNRPYLWHLEKVAGLATRLGYPDEVIAACWLHDVVEDTDVGIADLSDFPQSIINAVEAVTFDKTIDKDKLDKAKKTPLGHVVKYCDASINFSASAIDGPRAGHTQWEVSVERYPVYLIRLHLGLPTPQEINKHLEDLNTNVQ